MAAIKETTGITATKVCNDCHVEKPHDDFYAYKAGHLYPSCKACHYVKTQASRAKHIEVIRERARERYHAGDRVRKIAEKRLRKYGLTQAAFDALLQGQGGVCAVCRRPFEDSYSGLRGHGAGGGRWELASVDHDHETGAVRGILHRRCNLAIELLPSDDELQGARNYLAAHAKRKDA